MPTHAALFAEKLKRKKTQLKHRVRKPTVPKLTRLKTQSKQNSDCPHEENGVVWFRITPSYKSRDDLLRMRERLKDWEQVYSEEEKMLFYWNREMKSSQWEKPFATRNGSRVVALRGKPRRGIVVSALYIDKESGDEVLDLFMEPLEGSRECGELLERVSTREIELERVVKIPDVPKIPLCQLRRQVVKTRICDTLENAFRLYADRPFIGYEREKNKFSYLSYDRVYSMSSSVRDALWRHGIQPGSFVGICGVNCVNWIRIMFGILMADCVPVPMSCHLIDEHVVHILKESKVTMVFTAERQFNMIHDGTQKISLKDRPLVVRFSSYDGTTRTVKPKKLPQCNTEELRTWLVQNQPLDDVPLVILRKNNSIKETFDSSRERSKREAQIILLRGLGYDDSESLHALKRADGDLYACIQDLKGEEEEVSGAVPRLRVFQSSQEEKTFTYNYNAPSQDIKYVAPEAKYPHRAAYILYTSGSTGLPKGAIVPFENFQVETCGYLRTSTAVDDSGVSLIDSPMAVSSFPYALLGCLLNGSRLAIFEPLSRVFDVCKIVSPDTMSCVPQVWNTLFKTYQKRLECGEDKKKLNKEFSECLGFRISGLNCGGAKPMPEVQAWLKRIFKSCNITENYASTECGAITYTYGEHDDGEITAGVEIKLEDYMDYKTTDKPYPRGEILVRSKTGAHGYLNRPDLTAKSWSKDGFFHTGDIGTMIDSKHIRIIDRKKNIFKLSNGEWVSPEAVEAVICGECDSVKQIFIHGSSSIAHVVAVVVPSSDRVRAEDVVRDCSKLGDKLRHFERPRLGGIVLSRKNFNMKDGTLTQTQKLCRWQIRQRHKTEIQTMLSRSKELDEEIEQNQAKTLIRLINLEIRNQGSAEKRREAWRDLEWSSINVTMLQGVIRSSFQRSISIDSLWVSRESLKTIASLISDTTKVHQNDNDDNEEKQDDEKRWYREIEFETSNLNKIREIMRKEKSSTQKSSVFLTGATGFLGSEVLSQLVGGVGLARGRKIYCLVRTKRKNQSPKTRLCDILRVRKCFTKDVDDALSSGQIVAVRGDLTLPQFGMVNFETIARETSLVIHCGSFVNHIFNYSNLKAANVGGTMNAIELATYNRASVVYISTISVLPNKLSLARNSETEIAGSMSYLNKAGGYVQSKWVAEIRLRNATQMGAISDVKILRPGLITPNSKTGASNMTDWFTRFIHGTILLGGYRVSNESNDTLCFTSVDDVASVVKTFALSKSSSTQQQNASTYHIPVTIKMKTAKFMKLVQTSDSLVGRVVRSFTKWEWKSAMNDLPETNPIYPLRHYYAENGLGSCEGHDHVETTRVLKHLGCVANGERLRPYTSVEVDRIVSYIIQNSKVLDSPRGLSLMRHKSKKRVRMKGVVHEKNYVKKMSNTGRELLLLGTSRSKSDS